MNRNPALSPFLYSYAVFLLVGLLLVGYYDQGFFVVWLDEVHQPVLDRAMLGLTYLGDGAALAVLCLVFCLFRYKYAIILTIIGLLQLLSVAVLKKAIFGRTPRPLSYLEADALPNLVTSIDIHHWYSFPSGHAVTAFGLCLFVALVNEKRTIAIWALLAAVLIGMSRVYLAQHFLVDVLAGSVVGVAITGLCYYTASRIPAFWQNQKLNLPYASLESVT